MRQDKLTSQFQRALAEAQSLAVTRDNPYIEAGARARRHAGAGRRPARACSSAGRAHRRRCTAVETAERPAAGAGRRPPAPGATCLLLQAAERRASKRGDQYIASEMFLLAAGRRQERPGGIARATA